MNTQSTHTAHSRRRFALHIVLGAIAVITLGLSGSAVAAPSLEQSQWELIELQGKAINVAGKKSRGGATLKLDPTNKRMAGSAPVNRYFGSYQLTGDKIKFSNIGATSMAGEAGAMELESTYFKMLASVTHWRITDDKLELLQDDKVLARFAEQSPAAK